MSAAERIPAGLVHAFAGMDVPCLLRSRAVTHRDHPFLIWAPFEAPSRTWTYGQFNDRVGALAAGLVARGLRQGDSLLIHLDNCIELLLAWFACAESGIRAVTTNTRASGADLAYFADTCEASAAITQPAYAELIAAHCRNLHWIAVVSPDPGGTAAAGGLPGKSDAFDTLFSDAAERPSRAPDPLADCSVQFTSGTSSRPKGVIWTHANALWGAKVGAQHEALRPDDVHLIHLPLFHTNALAYSLLPALWVGASAVIMPRFSASRFWATAIQHRCTWSSMIQFCLRALADREPPERHSFRLWGSGVSSPPTDTRFGIKTIGWWGMTETISHGIVGELHHENVPLSIGRAAPEYEIRVVRENGGPTEPDEPGELLIRGVPGISLFKEYLNNPTATSQSFDAQGFFATGDRVKVLPGGAICFTDRSKDLLKIGGENVAASEIERVAASVPGVREAAVVGKRHPMLDEVPVLFVIPHGGVRQARPGLAEEIMTSCKQKLADFKVPCEIRVMDDFPRATLGKVSKVELAKLV